MKEIFTGIIEELGEVKSISRHSLCIKAAKVLEQTQIGDSIAVNGVCLTVTALKGDSFTADVMPETFQRSALGTLQPHSRVNLERALQHLSRMGGHLVSGHIDTVGVITGIKKDGNAVILTIALNEDSLRYVVEKGSIAIDGISLTVVSVDDAGFTVSLIPHTYAVTGLSAKLVGSKVNIETDIIAKYVEKLLNIDRDKKNTEKKSALSREFLARSGF